MLYTSSLDKVGEYIEQLEEGGKQARKRVIELVDEVNKLKEENKKLKEKIKRLEFDVDAWYQLKLLLEGEIERLGKKRDEYKEKLNKAGLEEYGFFNEY